MKSIIIAALCFLALPVMAEELKPVKNGVYRWADHPVKLGELRESRRILEGTSAHLEYFRMHATTQYVGAKPGKAHANEDMEEVLIVKEGLMKLTIEGKSTIMGAGSVMLLMPQQMHSLENVGDTPLTYFVMKYKSKKKMQIERGIAGGGSMMLNINDLPLKASKPKDGQRRSGRKYFDRATAMCERFEMHITHLHNKGPSHPPHKHVETEIIMVLDGETLMEIDGETYTGRAGDFYLMESQLEHGVSNVSDTKPASYFAFKWN